MSIKQDLNSELFISPSIPGLQKILNFVLQLFKWPDMIPLAAMHLLISFAPTPALILTSLSFKEFTRVFLIVVPILGNIRVITKTAVYQF